jgi:hypothetical protein
MYANTASTDTSTNGYAEAEAAGANVLALVEMLHKNARTALLANCILAGAVALVMRGAVETPILIAWLAILLPLNGARFLHIAASRAPGAVIDEGRPWARFFTFGAGLTGAVWGIGAVVMFPPEAIQLQVFLAFVLGGLAAGAVVYAASWLPSYFAFAVPMLAPLIFRFFLEPGELPLVMGSMLIPFVVFLGSLARSFNAPLKQSLSLRNERSRLLDERNSNEMFFAKTFHNSPVLMTLSEPKDGSHFDVNRAWTTLTGIATKTPWESRRLNWASGQTLRTGPPLSKRSSATARLPVSRPFFAPAKAPSGICWSPANSSATVTATSCCLSARTSRGKKKWSV